MINFQAELKPDLLHSSWKELMAYHSLWLKNWAQLVSTSRSSRCWGAWCSHYWRLELLCLHSWLASSAVHLMSFGCLLQSLRCLLCLLRWLWCWLQQCYSAQLRPQPFTWQELRRSTSHFSSSASLLEVPMGQELELPSASARRYARPTAGLEWACYPITHSVG